MVSSSSSTMIRLQVLLQLLLYIATNIYRNLQSRQDSKRFKTKCILTKNCDVYAITTSKPLDKESLITME